MFLNSSSLRMIFKVMHTVFSLTDMLNSHLQCVLQGSYIYMCKRHRQWKLYPRNMSVKFENNSGLEFTFILQDSRFA